MRVLRYAALLIAAFFACVPAQVRAQVAPAFSTNYTAVQFVLSSASTTAGSSPASLSVAGMSSCTVTLDPSTSPAWAGTITFEGASQGSFQPVGAVIATPGSSPLTSTTSGGLYLVSVAGLGTFDVRQSAVSQGSMTVSIACSPLPGSNVASKAPTASPGGFQAMQRILYGNSATYVDSAIDEIAYTAAIQSATTTEVVAGAAGKYTFLGNAIAFLGSTNSNAYVYLEYGTGATCGTGTTNITQYVNIGTANGTQTVLFPQLFGPLVIPQGDNLCAVTAGSTIYVIVQAYYTQHA